MEIKRDVYLNKIIRSRGNGMIKIITGLRRCGKSYLLFNLFYNYLINNGVERDAIIRLALDDVRNEKYLNPVELVNYVESQLKSGTMNYILLDEVQLVNNFTGALNTLLRMDNVDVYVTGSNSHFLSTDIATEFRGRGDEIHLYPLSFAEFSSFFNGEYSKAWREYVRYGGLPQVVMLEGKEAKEQYLRNLYHSVYIKDLFERNKILKEAPFEDLVKMLASSIGSPSNPHKLSNTFKSVINEDLHADTIYKYIKYLEDAFLIEQAQRFDVKGKKYIGSLSKYYFTDIGLRNAILDFRQQEETHIMENVIYNELKTRGLSVDVGMVEVRKKSGEVMEKRQLEVDFVVNSGSYRCYIQSALSIPDKEKMKQESASLINIKDAFKKIIVVRDDIIPWFTDDGIYITGLFDFLLNPKITDMD